MVNYPERFPVTWLFTSTYTVHLFGELIKKKLQEELLCTVIIGTQVYEREKALMTSSGQFGWSVTTCFFESIVTLKWPKKSRPNKPSAP